MNDEMEKLKKRAKWIKRAAGVLEILIVALVGCLFVSFYRECTGQISLYMLHFKHPWSLPSLMNAKAIQEVAKTIGVSSVFVVWIYAELGKEQLGIKYDRLLKKVCPFYHIFVIVHIATILLCIWLTEVQFMECIAIALLIVLLSLALQAIVFILFVLSPVIREQVALDTWKNELTGQIPQLEAFSKLENELPYHKASVCKEMCSIWVAGILKYYSAHSDCSCITDISYRWEYLMCEKTTSQQRLLTLRCFEALGSISKNHHKERFVLYASYWLWYIRTYSIEKKSPKELTYILDMTNWIRGKISTDCESVQCLFLLYTLLSWTYFLSGKVLITSSQLTVFDPSPLVWENCKEMGMYFSNQVLEEDLSQELLEVAWKHSF